MDFPGIPRSLRYPPPAHERSHHGTRHPGSRNRCCSPSPLDPSPSRLMPEHTRHPRMSRPGHSSQETSSCFPLLQAQYSGRYAARTPPMRWDGGPFLEAATISGKRPRRQANQVSGCAGSALVTFDPYLRVDEPDMACALGAPAAPITSLRTATRGWVGVSLREGNHREENWNGPFHVGTTHGMEATEAERLRAVLGLRATRPRVAVREVLEEGRARGEHLLVNDIVTRTRARAGTCPHRWSTTASRRSAASVSYGGWRRSSRTEVVSSCLRLRRCMSGLWPRWGADPRENAPSVSRQAWSCPHQQP